jgi:chitinase
MGGGSGYRAVGYFTNWGIYARGYTPDKVPVKKLTHILYAFADNRENSSLVLTDPWSDTDKHYPGDSWNDTGNNIYGNLKQLYLLKKKNRNLKILLSIGGWTYTQEQKHFDAPASTDAGRKAFAQSCVQFIKDYGFDGIDVDWEYPRDTDQGNQLLLLLQEIRGAFDAYANQIASSHSEGGHKPYFELSIAAPGGKQNYMNLPLGQISHTLDFINIMAYDFAGSWDQVSGHQANLYPSQSCASCTPFNIQSIINDYVAAGVPSRQLVLGMPLYGRAFANTDGLGKSFQGVGAPDQEHGSWEGGVWDYKALPRPNAVEHIDEEAGASYSYDPGNRTLISYGMADFILMNMRHE